MTTPRSDEPPGQRRADVPRPGASGAGQPAQSDDVRRAGDAAGDDAIQGYTHPESALGGADSVQKTSYVTGEGTEPAGAPRAGVVARAGTGGGVNIGAWVVGLVALAIALVYAFGIFR